MKAREPVGVGHLLSLGQLRNAGSLCYSSSPKVPSHLGFYFIPFTDFLKMLSFFKVNEDREQYISILLVEIF